MLIQYPPHTGVPKPGVFWVLTPPTFLALNPPQSEIAKKLGKILKYTPTFKVLSTPLST